MTIREIVFSRNTTYAGLFALIGLRCYPDELPEDVTYPAISYLIVSTVDTIYRTHDGAPSRAVSRVQMNCWAELPDDVWAVAEQIRSAWSGYNDSCTVGYAFINNEISGYETGINKYRVAVDVTIDYLLEGF